MKKHLFPRLLTLFLVLMTLSVCASAIEIKLYDNGELSNTLTSRDRYASRRTGA